MRDSPLEPPSEELFSAVAAAESSERPAAARTSMQVGRVDSKRQAFLDKLAWGRHSDENEEDMADKEEAPGQLEKDAEMRQAWEEAVKGIPCHRASFPQDWQCEHQQQASAESAAAMPSAINPSSPDAPPSLPPMDHVDLQEMMVIIPTSHPLNAVLPSCYAMQMHFRKTTVLAFSVIASG